MESGRTLYKGGCQCGLFAYESHLSETQTAYKCDCSLCVKKGYLWIFPGQNNFTVLRGSEDSLTTFQFGPKKLSHKFCPRCGTSCLACTKGDDPEFDLALNVHAIFELDTTLLERTPYPGASVGDQYIYPSHTGILPTKVLRNDEIYTGSCHCGALTLATNVRLGNQKSVAACNCGFCHLGECTWVYPKPGQTVVAGDAASIVRYAKGRHTLIFCKTCGVYMAIEERNGSEQLGIELHERESQDEAGLGVIHAVNARVLHDIEPSSRKRLNL